MSSADVVKEKKAVLIALPGPSDMSYKQDSRGQFNNIII